MIRLFIALQIPVEIQNRIISLCKSIFIDYHSYSWEQKEKIHLTLKFIGDFDEAHLPELLEELQFFNDVKLFYLQLTRLGLFYNEDIPKILWVGLNSDERLIELAKNLNDRLEKFKIRSEKKKFKPHLTLLRIKNQVSESFINTVKTSHLEKIDFVSNRIVLMQSTLTKRGSIYNQVKIFELK
jgi:RNA 2',3'-cyclic 3'-phosphodiesterase